MRHKAETPEAKQWEGWGTALKPAFEPIVVARKLLSEKNVASNVLKWGTGGISISESRIISDKKRKFLDYVNKISANVFPLIGNNIAYKDQKNDAIALDRNFDKLFSFLVGDSYLLVGNEELYVQNHNYQKFSNFLDNCPVCFHLCDALVHLFASSDLISVQQLTDVHKYIHLFEQKDGQVVSPLHSREKYNGLPSNEDFFQKIEDQSVKKIYCDEEYHIYQEYLKLFHKNNHICLPSGLNQTKFPSGILDKSFFLHLLQTDNSNEFSCFLLKYLITFIITNTVHLVKEKINHQGRFPANLILSEEGAEELDKQSGTLKSGIVKQGYRRHTDSQFIQGNESQLTGFGDFGGASRFFYVAKASKRERDMGCEGLEEITKTGMNASPREYDGKVHGEVKLRNNHPTVKPLKLMEYLVKLVTPPKGIVLDPFAGSGTTCMSCKKLGFNYIGIEQDKSYCEIAETRIKAIKEDLRLF